MQSASKEKAFLWVYRSAASVSASLLKRGRSAGAGCMQSWAICPRASDAALSPFVASTRSHTSFTNRPHARTYTGESVGQLLDDDSSSSV